MLERRERLEGKGDKSEGQTVSRSQLRIGKNRMALMKKMVFFGGVEKDMGAQVWDVVRAA
jgi:hypothetical protein